MYKFDPKLHAHTLDGKPLMGVTTVLSVISKPMLIQWAANMACDYISDHAEIPLNGQSGLHISEKVLREARTAHRTKKEAAGDWGTIVHKAIEEWIKDKKDTILEGNQQTAFDHFKDWAIDNNVEFLESEKHLYSEKMWIGGICDLVIKMNGKKYVADIKTSSGIYNEAFFQMAAYALMLEEQGVNDIEGYLVINLKKDGTMDLKRADNMEINKEAFKHALGLYQIIQSIK